MKSCLLCLFLIGCLGCKAAEWWFDPSRKYAPDFYFVESMPEAIDRAKIHVRLAVDPSKKAEWGIVWNKTSDNSFVRATLILPKKNPQEDLFKQYATVSVEVFDHGVLSSSVDYELSDGLDFDGRPNSVKLVFDQGTARLFVGADMQEEVAKVPFVSSGGDVGFFCNCPAEVRRVHSSFRNASVIAHGRFADINQLVEYLKSSSDPMEGTWEYMDRTLNTEKASLGGRYVLATVRDGDAYDIVYLRGAEVGLGDWKPLMLKGRIIPTIFKNDFDLEWIDADGRMVVDDVNAQVSDDFAILTFRFPVIEAQLRFRRLLLR